MDAGLVMALGLGVNRLIHQHAYGFGKVRQIGVVTAPFVYALDPAIGRNEADAPGLALVV